MAKKTPDLVIPPNLASLKPPCAVTVSLYQSSLSAGLDNICSLWWLCLLVCPATHVDGTIRMGIVLRL